jgi:hypothetical protein
MPDDKRHTIKEQFRGYIKTALLVIAFIGLVYSENHHLGRFGGAAIALLCGGVLIGTVVVGVRSGATTMVYSTVMRADDPLGFWTSTVISGVAGATAIILSIGVLFGLWQF